MKQICYTDAMRVIEGSKEFSFENHTTILIRSYYTGKEVRLDLSKMTPEIYEQLREDDPLTAIYKRCAENISDWPERRSAALADLDKRDVPDAEIGGGLYYAVQAEIEEYCWDNDMFWQDLDFGPEDVILFGCA